MNDIDNANDINRILINYCVLALLLYMLTITVSFQKQIVLLVVVNYLYCTHSLHVAIPAFRTQLFISELDEWMIS